MTKDNNIFKIKLYGLSEDMEDFLLEQNDRFNHEKQEFWTSFWNTCAEMWSEGIDLTPKQLEIIYREYDKVKDKRVKEYEERK